MTRGFLLIIIWSVLMVTCDAMFDVLYHRPLKDDSRLIEIPIATREDDLMLEFMRNSANFHYVVPLLFTKRRRNVYPSVEAGPGAFKSEIVQYPPDLLKNQLSNLLKLKKKLEERGQ